jgi:hypothetical protein
MIGFTAHRMMELAIDGLTGEAVGSRDVGLGIPRARGAAGHGYRSIWSGEVLDGILAQPRPARSARPRAYIWDAHEGIKAAVANHCTAHGNAAACRSCAMCSPILPAMVSVSLPLSPALPSSRRMRIRLRWNGAKLQISCVSTCPKWLGLWTRRRPTCLPLSFPKGAITRPVEALLLEQNDEWAVQRGRYMSLETVARLSDDRIIKLHAVAA